MSQVENTENEPGGDSEKLACVVSECDERISAQGYHGHLRFKHDFTSDDAREAFEKAKENESNEVSGGEGGGEAYPQAVEEGGEEPESELFHVENDPEVQRLERERERLKRLVEVNRYESMLTEGEGDSGELDDLERLIKFKELLEDDGGGDDTEAVREELRALRTEMMQQQQQSSGIDLSTDDPLALLIANGGDTDLDPETLAVMQEMRQKSVGEALIEGVEKVDWSAVGNALGGLVATAGAGAPEPDERVREEQPPRRSRAEMAVNRNQTNDGGHDNGETARDDVQRPGDGGSSDAGDDDDRQQGRDNDDGDDGGGE
jgi:hypothetical protein